MKTKLIASTVLWFMAAILWVFPGARIPILDRHADQYFNDAIQKAGLAYATTRVLNASVSVIKNSELRLEPGGVGLTIAAGQVVDPIDDMTERLSDVLVTAIASLGIQRLLYQMSVSLVPYGLAAAFVALSTLFWIERWPSGMLREYILGATALIIVARLFLPASALVNDFLYQNFFSDDIAAARKNLTLASRELDKLTEIQMPEISGIAGTIKNTTVFLKSKTIEFKDSVIAITNNMGGIVSSLLQLTWLYVGIFFVQVIALPIGVFWLLVKITNALLSTQLSGILRQSNILERKNR